MLDLYEFYQAQGTVVKVMFWVAYFAVCVGTW